MLSSAVLRYPTIEEFESITPFALKGKSTGNVYTVETIHHREKEIQFNYGSCFKISDLANLYLIKTATETEYHEIGEWVKA